MRAQVGVAAWLIAPNGASVGWRSGLAAPAHNRAVRRAAVGRESDL